MNQNILMKDYLVKNTTRVNSILSKFILAFAILCPALLIANQAGVTNYETDILFKICLGFVVLSVIPCLFCHFNYNDTMNRCICLSCLELLIGLIACNNLIEVNIILVIVPIVSLLYVNMEIFIHSARNCFVIFLAVKLLQMYTDMCSSIFVSYAYQKSYQSLVGLVIEYLLIMVVLYLLCGHVIEMVYSGYKLEKMADGSYVTPSVIPQEQQVSDAYNTKGIFLEVNQTIHNLIRGKEKQFFLDVDYELPTMLCGDKEKIKLAMVNLLSDFVQFTQKGEVSLKVSYEKGIIPKKGQSITLICKVSCSEDLTEDLRYGNALGFALGKNMIQKMNGVILDKTSAGPDRKTCYVISLLQRVEREETIMQQKMQHREEQKELISDSRKKAQDIMLAKQVRALIVDDSQANLRLVSAILKSYGMQTVCVSSGETAIEKLRTKSFDFAIIDHMMPVKGGIQTAKEIRQMKDPYFEFLPLMAMSSNITEESKQMFYDCGFTEVISKPVKEDEVRQAMSRCMFL